MVVKYEIKEYSSFGRCLCIENDTMELYVTIDIGPRIIKFNLKGKDNMLYEDKQLLVYRDEPNLKEMFGKDARWNVYGGHRFWVSPEKHPQTYYPDNTPVEYAVDGNKFSFYAPKQIFTGWQEIIEITVADNDASVSVKHILTNMSDRPQEAAIWALSVADTGSVAYVKQSANQTGLLPNRVLMLWPYSDYKDSRFYMDNEYVGLIQDPACEKPFKLGTNNTDGVIVCSNHDTVFIISYDYVNGAEYADNGCSFESYLCKYYLELEAFSPLSLVKPGETREFTEKWELYPEKSTDIKDLAKYF